MFREAAQVDCADPKYIVDIIEAADGRLAAFLVAWPRISIRMFGFFALPEMLSELIYLDNLL